MANFIWPMIEANITYISFVIFQHEYLNESIQNYISILKTFY